ncbi:MAG: iron ABC transporter permease [Candidatus Cloacimonetes bacterium]|nr:iron ABC transporter permease [Candidatus Cloacimonadota bacterium]
MKFKTTIVIMFLMLLLAAFSYLFADESAQNIITNIRLPRLILTLFTGVVLGITGAIFQAMLNNPLAEPYILGVSTGAALGRTIAAISGFYLIMPIFGFGGAVLSMFIVWGIANYRGYFDNTRLILAGIVVGMFFSALISLLMYLNRSEISGIFGILMGNLGHIFSNKEWNSFLITLGISVVLIFYLFSKATELNILTTGEDSAGSLGIKTDKLRKTVFFVSSLLIGTVVSFAGVIGFIGLIIPHMMRMLLGADVRKNMISSAMCGALVLLICDYIAANLTVVEIPVGIITSFLGTPFFVFILIRKTE